MTDILERLAERQGPRSVNQPGAQNKGDDRTLERFLKFAPPKFIEGPDPELEENWLERITNIFAVLDYTKERPSLPSNLRVQHKREDEFVKLRRGASSVADYEGRFIKLSKYAPKLVANERRRIRRFVQGLNVEIQEGLAATQISTFTEVLEKAQRVENARLQVRNFHAKKKGAPSHPSGQISKSVTPPKMGRGASRLMTTGARRRALSRGGRTGQGQARGIHSGGQAVTPQVSCGYCSKSIHVENDCWRKSKKCLYCDSAEHQLSNCPSVPKVGGSTQQPEKPTSKQSSAGRSRPKVPARIYALDHQQILDSTEIVEGMIPIFHR
nr:uncharacterized protein LOC113693827 [Coffea arabica]